jgi:hypothetical protein
VLLLPCVLQRTADFLRANKLGHCLLWSSHAGTSAAGDGPLPKQAAPYQHASPAHRVSSNTVHSTTMSVSIKDACCVQQGMADCLAPLLY